MACTVRFGSGRVSGDVSTSNSQLTLNFDTKFAGVECWVPKSALGPPGQNGTTGSPTDGEPLVVDAKFETSNCAPFKDW